MGPGILHPLRQQTGLLGRQGRLLSGFSPARLQHTAHRGLGHQAVFLGRLEDASQVDQHLGLQGITFLGQRGHDGLDLYGADVPQAVTPDVGKDVLVQDVLDGVETVLPQVGLFVEVVPHLGEVAEGLLAANVHPRIDQDLGLHHLFVQFSLGLGPEVLSGAVRELDRLGKIGVLLFGACLCHMALSFQ